MVIESGIPAAEGGLHPGHNASYEDCGAYNVTLSWVIVTHAECRCQDEWDSHNGTYHREVVLKW